MSSSLVLNCKKDGKMIWLDAHFFGNPCTDFGMWMEKIYGAIDIFCVDGARRVRPEIELRDSDARSIMHAASNMKTYSRLDIHELEKYLEEHILKQVCVEIR